MDNSPDKVFARMEKTDAREAAPGNTMETGAAAKPIVPEMIGAYSPQKVRNGAYYRLMRSHDRMGSRYLQK